MESFTGISQRFSRNLKLCFFMFLKFRNSFFKEHLVVLNKKSNIFEKKTRMFWAKQNFVRSKCYPGDTSEIPLPWQLLLNVVNDKA